MRRAFFAIVDDSVEFDDFSFLVKPLPETAMVVLCNCLVGALPYTITLGDTIIAVVQI